MKVHIKGFRGPWGWLFNFENYLKQTTYTHNITIVPIEDADVIFQVDKDSGYNETSKYFDEKIIIGNMLDFAEWAKPVNENIPLQNYLKFIEKCDIVTGISTKVIEQTKELFPDKTYKIFNYPSQVSNADIFEVKMPKSPYFISFSRLADKGKRIELAVNAFHESGLVNKGYSYKLIGPQTPTFEIPYGVSYYGYMQKNDLFRNIRFATATIMPSKGEGLGLPAIESSLLGTIPIMTKIRPMTDIFEEAPYQFFTTQEELTKAMLWVAEINEREYGVYGMLSQAQAFPWEKNFAFDSLIEMFMELQ
jgi:hypothetical protein